MAESKRFIRSMRTAEVEHYASDAGKLDRGIRRDFQQEVRRRDRRRAKRKQHAAV